MIVKLFSNKTPGIEHYLNIGAWKTGISYIYVITTEGTRVELYIDKGKTNWNKNIYDSLVKNKPKIEETIGYTFGKTWLRFRINLTSIAHHSVSNIFWMASVAGLTQ